MTNSRDEWKIIPMQSNPKVVPPGSGKPLHALGGVVTAIVVGADTGGAYTVLQQETRPGGGPPLHRHSREDEGFFVVAGDFEFQVGERTFQAGTGTFVFGPRGIAHAFKCLGPAPGMMQVILTPPGFEALFEEVDALSSQGPPDRAQLVALAGKYGVEILGPPPG
jgi:quercetin dioxygenase-like cupin family protein